MNRVLNTNESNSRADPDYDFASLMMGVLIGLRLACIKFRRNFMAECGL